MTIYDSAFYRVNEGGSSASASIIAPLALSFVPAASVCDIGCGIGTWLAAFRAAGVEDVLGVDGDYVNRSMLKFPPERFVGHDLRQRIDIPRSFDLAVSVEVAEHLPASSAPLLVESLTRLAPVVLFSAAIPFQGGAEHINEQWQDYWRDLFRPHDYVPIDCIRPAVWNDESVDWWYRQNILVYCKKDRLEHYPALAALGEARIVSMAHPIAYKNMGSRVAEASYLSAALKAIPTLTKRAILRRMGRIKA